MASTNKVSQKDVAAQLNRIYGVSWDSFRWGEYYWDDSSLQGSGAIGHHFDAVAPSGYEDYMGGIGEKDALEVVSLNVSPSGDWVPAIKPGSFYLGNRRYYMYRDRERSIIPRTEYEVVASGVNLAHPVTVYNPWDAEITMSGGYQEPDTIVYRSDQCETTYIARSTPTSNYATATTLSIRGTAAALETRSLVRWPNLVGRGKNQIPTRSEIEKAELTLYCAEASTFPAFLYRALVPWTETGATWLTRDGTNTWGEVGPSGDIDHVDEPDDPSSITFGATAMFTYNAASGVQAWVDGQPNYGWILRMDSGDDGLSLASDNTATQTNRPHLSVVYRPPDYELQMSPVYAYPVDPDMESPHPGVYRQVPDWSLLSGVHPSLSGGEASEDDSVWEPSGGQFWVSRPKWYDIPSSGVPHNNVVGLAETETDDLPHNVQIRVAVDDDLYVDYDNVNASGDYVRFDRDMDLNPTDSFVYRNKMLVLTDGAISSGVLVLHDPMTPSVQYNEIIHLIGSLVSEEGIPLEGIPVRVNTRNAIGNFVSSDMTLLTSMLPTWNVTGKDGTVHYRYKVQPTAGIYLTPMSFQLEAPDMDIVSDWLDIDCADSLLS